MVAGAASAVGYNGKFEFPKIGSEYDAVSSAKRALRCVFALSMTGFRMKYPISKLVSRRQSSAAIVPIISPINTARSDTRFRALKFMQIII